MKYYLKSIIVDEEYKGKDVSTIELTKDQMDAVITLVFKGKDELGDYEQND